MDDSFFKARQLMVQKQIISRGVTDPAVIHAMATVPRHEFVLESLKSQAYQDSPLPISDGQTISQPYIVALMAESAKIDSGSKILEIGTGSGYGAAVLSLIGKEIYTVERIPSLATKSKDILDRLNYKNIQVFISDGTLGLPNHAPFDAIIVTAAAPVIPHSFLNQLTIGGRLIIPIGTTLSQQLLRLTKTAEDKCEEEVISLVRFVPLVGEQGW